MTYFLRYLVSKKDLGSFFLKKMAYFLRRSPHMNLCVICPTHDGDKTRDGISVCFFENKKSLCRVLYSLETKQIPLYIWSICILLNCSLTIILIRIDMCSSRMEKCRRNYNQPPPPCNIHQNCVVKSFAKVHHHHPTADCQKFPLDMQLVFREHGQNILLIASR